VVTAEVRPAGGAPRFETTTRWLRGRIVARLRTLDEGTWEHLPDRIGGHDEVAIGAAVAALQQDGLVECRPDGAVRLPSN
jgi:hypothetical protein